MNGLLNQIGQERGIGPAIHRPSITETLRDQKAFHEEKLEKINRALKALEEYPQFATCLEVIQQAF